MSTSSHFENLKNVLFAPFVFDGEIAGLIGIGNKKNDVFFGRLTNRTCQQAKENEAATRCLLQIVHRDSLPIVFTCLSKLVS